MQIILLSGGSGSRLWPLSNEARSKQFLKLLPIEGSEERESMIQRVIRQIAEYGLEAEVTIATSISQRDSVTTQLGKKVNIVTEPSRRKTLAAICLTAEYLAKEKRCRDNETVIVMPCDPYTGRGYYEAIREMANFTSTGERDLTLLGIRPTYPSTKYGYVMPDYSKRDGGAYIVKRFVEKPSVDIARLLIEDGGLWSGGVFACKLKYLLNISKKYIGNTSSFTEVISKFEDFPKISFDYEIVEKEKSLAVVPYYGEWRDLGTWLTLTDELKHYTYGNVTSDGQQKNTHIINELDIPLMCIGTSNLIIAASPDGILVSEKNKSEDIKKFVGDLCQRPMFEERRWGWYKVIDSVQFPDGFCALTKQLTLNPGGALSYQRHNCRDEVWTFISGEGEIVLDGERKNVKRGDTVYIPKGSKHALYAHSSLTFIEVQSGTNLIEEDIERFPYNW